MIIDQGKLLFDGQLSQLRARFGGKRELVVDFAERYDSASVVGADLVSLENQRATYQFSRGETTASELIQRISSQYRIRDLEVREPDIETTIRRIYEERLLATE
jgi:ABC-2 type transport system ATP-binding protein